MVPGDKETITNETKVNETSTEETNELRDVYVEKAEVPAPEHSEEELKALALAYAKYLAEQDKKPGDATFIEPEELLSEKAALSEEEPQDEVAQEAAAEEISEEETEEVVEKAAEENADTETISVENAAEESVPDKDGLDEKAVQKIIKRFDKENKGNAVTSVVDLHDRIQGNICEAATTAGRDFLTAGHKITSTYRQSRRMIGLALLLIGVFAAVILAVFDRFTVYEYAYNGKVLGYIKNQEDIIDVLDIAGTKMTENNSGEGEIAFIANQNVTFNLVDARGKSIDDADIAVNKLVYMTDIETEAFGIYDGKELVAIVKSSEEAENLLNQSMEVLSEPDDGMKLVSAEFTNELDIRPVNVLLTSVQSYSDALRKMTKGGESEIYHIVEADENLGRIARKFSVEPISIFDENNKSVVSMVEPGDKVCIRKTISPVSVKMVEKGRMKEIIEFETIKKKSDQYYEGDTHIEQEGVNGQQIFEGTLTKIGGEVTDRDEDKITTLVEKQDKIILIGTAERPKTAPTGTYVMPIHNYVLTSNFGYRWGRLHAGIDMGAPTGTPIYATDGGTVVKSEYYSGYGNVVFIQHEDGRQTRYAHCSQLLVTYGEKVYQGQLIALVGNTGHSFGSHLHFEVVLNGSPVNPRPFLGI